MAVVLVGTMDLSKLLMSGGEEFVHGASITVSVTSVI
jgi:hypothetical protein